MKHVFHIFSFVIFYMTIGFLGIHAQERLYTSYERGGSENGVVGKINGELDVSPIGQLSYEIPIPALPGTGGMKPNISVCYNSSTKNGLAGYGFDIAGLSIISRVPSDRFHEGIARSIDFTSHDHFSLDGQRLVNYSYSNDTETEYRTEANTFAKILAKGKSYNPTSFKVHTKSGLVYEYVSVAKALGQADNDSTLFWLVSKVSDTKGNYFTVSYEGNAETNDFRPSRIDYTGNAAAALSPYASILFSYINDTYSPITYVNGVKVKRSKILSAVSLYMGSKMIRTFQLTYQIVNRKHQLVKISERTSTGVHKNPTQFTWTNLSDFNVKNYNYSHTNLVHKAKLTVGDFNGDGKADFIATPEDKNAGWKGWKLFVSHGTYFEQVATGTWNWNDDELEQVVCGDFNGDGYTDVVAKRCHSGKYHNCDLYLATITNGKPDLSFSDCFLSLTTDYTIQTVELNGDGASDLFAWLSNSKECRLIYSTHGSNGITPFGYTATRKCSEKWDRVEFGDFNGDGLTDVMNLDDKGNYIMYSDGAGTMTKQTSSTWPDKNHYMEFGDFNGDGKTDMLLTGWANDSNKGGWSNWCICYSKGDGSFAKEYNSKPFDARSKQLYIMDLNGDGYDDFQAIDKTTDDGKMTQPQAYLNDGRGGFFQQVKGGNVYGTDKWHFYIGDFNGDGKADFVSTSDWNKSNWDGYQLYLMPTTQNALLTGIKDGMGNSTEITYSYLTEKNTFTRGTTNSYPLISIGLSWPVVASVTTPNGIGGTNVVTYTYEDALFHNDGRGLLGFAKCQVKDETSNSLQTTNYSANTDKYIIAPTHSQTTVNGKLVDECDYAYELKTGYLQSSYNTSCYTFLPKTTHQTSYEYNTGVPIKDIETSYEYDSFGNATQTIVDDGNVETSTSCTFSNDEEKWLLGRLTESMVVKTNGNNTITRTSTFEYDRLSGLLTTETFLPDNNELGYKKSYVHDCYGNILESTVSPLDNSTEGRTTQTQYDKKGQHIISCTNSLGFTETSTYDDATGLLVSSTDKNGVTTDYSHDNFGNIVATSTPIAKSLKTVGWSNGMADAPANALYFEWNKSTGEPSTIEFYDCLGRLLRTVTESVNGKKVYADQSYDKRGLVDKTSEPYFAGEQQYCNQNEYDAIDRTVKQIAPDGSSYSFDYDGLETKTTDPLGNISTKNIDLNGLLVSSTDNNGATVTFKYDADGNCVETCSPRTTVSCIYDLAGHRVSLDDPDLGHSEDVYNAYGELVQHKDNHGETTYTYDGGGRMLEECRPDVTIRYTYDKGWKGAVDEVVYDGDTYSSNAYSYDDYGRLIQKNTAIDDKRYVTSYSYNAENKVETVTYPNGLKTINGYDACGMQTSVSNPDNGQLYWQLQELDARGQIEKEKYGNGLVTTTTHNPERGTIAEIQTPGVQDWRYAFDPVGNLVTRQDNSRNLTETFSYDNMHRLVEVEKNGQTTQAMAYDDAGNITKKSDVGTYAYKDGTNKLSNISNCKRELTKWDGITYNSFDKITNVTSGTNTVQISYGFDKSRVLVNIHGLWKYYVGNLFEQEICNDSVTSVCYVFACGKAVAIITYKTGYAEDVKYIHHDHLGSIQAFSDQNGKLFQELSYDAWGLRRDPDTWATYKTLTSSDAFNEHGFGGHEHIDLLEMINMDGRMYDPVVGRFLSADPIVQSPDFTQSYNRYAYCINNPLSLIDPSGYSWFSKNWKTITASIVGIAVSVVTAGSGSTVGVAIIAGAAGGAAGALTGALLNGANIGQIAKNTFIGAAVGAASGFLNFASADENLLASLFKHSFSEGWLEGVQGGNVLHGFMMGATSSMGGYFVDNSFESAGKLGKVAANAILSGTIDEIGGGKFANGAITGAFTILFNDMMHGGDGGDGCQKKEFSKAKIEERGGIYYLNGQIVGEKGLEYIWPEFELLTGLRGAFNTITTLFCTNSNAISIFLDSRHFTRLKGGVRQSFIETTNIDKLFRNLASRCNAKILHNGSERYFKAGRYRVGLHESSRGGGKTIHINFNNGESLYKLRSK